MRPKVRFDVFKRDDFTCQYCGRRVPDVVLEADHVIPRVEGGTDDPENLVAACMDCNRGKGGEGLGVVHPLPDLREQAETLREREAQIRAYHEALAERAERRSEVFGEVWNYWFDLFGAVSLQKWETPWRGPLQDAIEKLGADEVKEAMEITRQKFSWPSSKATRYFGGVLRRKVAASEGRVVPCAACGKPVVLDPGDDKTVEWWHKGCLEEEASG